MDYGGSTKQRLMLEGGLRLSHALHLVATFSPSEVVEILEIGLEALGCYRIDDKFKYL